MIKRVDKQNCCGCSACAQQCPIQCITMQEDSEGFLYPSVDLGTCIECRLCEKVCPVLNQADEHKPLVCYAAKNPNEEIRSTSSSGGIFLPIAEKIIREGGIVFGARFNNNWEVVHTSAEKMEDLKPFQGSKYVQSKIGTCYKDAERFLKEGRKVLFSGTPCQIAALHTFLRKQYDNLITVDVVCHGTPSPLVWRDYVSTLPMTGVEMIRMKDKSTGWRGYSFSLIDGNGKTTFTEKASVNKFLMAFSRNLTLRPSCFSCPAKSGKSQSDITLADYWGIEKMFPEMDDNKGTSFVCCNTERGKTVLSALNLQLTYANYETSIPFNSCIYKSTPEPEARNRFWMDYSKHGSKTLLALEPKGHSIIKRIIKRIFR